jgi:YggT family protein
MFVASNLVAAIARLLDLLLWAYVWILIIRALISWVSPDPYNPVVRFLLRVTEPVLRPIRQRLPATMGIDFSPMIVIIVIMFLQSFLVSSLHDLAVSLRY